MCTGRAQHSNLAIARTFASSDVDLLPESFESWKTFPPCHFDSFTRVDLYLVFSQNLSESLQAQAAIHAVQEVFDQGEDWSTCISNVFGIGVNIHPSDDVYSPQQLHSNVMWVNGPNRQFERTIRAMQNGPYEFMFLMEIDCVPSRANWLDMIIHEISSEASEFVMLGRYDLALCFAS